MPTSPDLSQSLDASGFVGLAVTFVHAGYNASVEWQDGHWSPHEFGVTASEAILKAITLHRPAVTLCPPLPALLPPPY